MAGPGIKATSRRDGGYVSLLTACVLACLSWAVASADDYNPKLDLWPVFRYWTSPDGPGRNLEALWPLFEWHDSKTSSEFYFRPLYNRRDDKQSKVVESEWLYPLGFGTHRPDLSRSVFYPLSLRDREKFPDGSVQRRRILLPIYYYRSGRGPTDLLVLPFGGVLHNILGREKIVIGVWPLFVYQRGKDVRSWSFLHPIFSFIRWDDGGRGFKVWPLFGLNRRPDKMVKFFALWPIGHYQRMKTEQGEKRRWWIFPLFGRIDDPGGWEWAALWPFFSHRVDRNLGRDDWWYPWPFLGRSTGENVSGWTFWPLYMTGRRGKDRSIRFLWPLGWYRRSEGPKARSVSLRLIPLMFREREEGPAGKSGAWQAWPLVKYRTDTEARADLEFPSVLPLRRHAGWERNFAPFFRIFEYHRDGGYRSWRLLWRLVRVDSGPAVRYVEVAPFFKIDSRRGPDSELRWTILKGLLGYERAGGRRTWRFLYFLRTRSNGEVEGAAVE